MQQAAALSPDAGPAALHRAPGVSIDATGHRLVPVGRGSAAENINFTRMSAINDEVPGQKISDRGLSGRGASEIRKHPVEWVVPEGR